MTRHTPRRLRPITEMERCTYAIESEKTVSVTNAWGFI